MQSASTSESSKRQMCLILAHLTLQVLAIHVPSYVVLMSLLRALLLAPSLGGISKNQNFCAVTLLPLFSSNCHVNYVVEISSSTKVYTSVNKRFEHYCILYTLALPSLSTPDLSYVYAWLHAFLGLIKTNNAS